MSDITATLLPSARVDFFVLDEGTQATAQQLSSDWRFARVGVRVTQGGIDVAIATYAQQASPEIILIETNDISENFIAQLGQLAGVCAEGTDAVIIGPMNDVHLYRSLVGMGVRDYLVRPVPENDLFNVIAKALIDKRGLSGARLSVVMGAKGGVGTTAIAQAIGWGVAQNVKQVTMLMDAAGSSGALGIGFGVEPHAPLSEAVRIGNSGSDDDFKRIIQKSGEHLSLLVCGGEPILTDPPDADAFEVMINRVLQKYPVVVLDLSGAAPGIQKRMMVRAAHITLVTTPLLPSLRNCRTLLNEIKQARGGSAEVDVILNMKGAAGGEEVAAKDIKQALDREPAAVLPYAPKVFMQAEAMGKPVGLNKAAAEILEALAPVIARAAGREPAADSKKDAGSQGLLKKLGIKK